ncbi:MAG: cytidine deaminase [Lachnobacterium sp.]|nr:cytidine deaminase [Lachnobacterium sp.]MDD6632900.1 cytidine deaminase [Lachnobacterium sp.]
MDRRELIDIALEARQMAYTPYSHHKVGAALLTKDGKVYRGCNIESASYTPSNCAERTAFFKAVSEGEREFEAIAIVGGFEDSPVLRLCAPCGVCRQVMMEFCDPETFEIILCDEKDELHTYKLEELLPLGFGPTNMGL